MHNISPNNKLAYFHTSHYDCIAQPSTIFHSFKISKLLVMLHLNVCINLTEFLYHTYADVLFILLNLLQFSIVLKSQNYSWYYISMFVLISLSFWIIHT
jgi:hypothetical protein